MVATPRCGRSSALCQQRRLSSLWCVDVSAADAGRPAAGAAARDHGGGAGGRRRGLAGPVRGDLQPGRGAPGDRAGRAAGRQPDCCASGSGSRRPARCSRRCCRPALTQSGVTSVTVADAGGRVVAATNPTLVGTALSCSAIRGVARGPRLVRRAARWTAPGAGRPRSRCSARRERRTSAATSAR